MKSKKVRLIPVGLMFGPQSNWCFKTQISHLMAHIVSFHIKIFKCQFKNLEKNLIIILQ
jgi:hypothetical protein